MNNDRILKLLAVPLALGTLLLNTSRAIEADPARHGPLDAHAVSVMAILNRMNLPADTLTNCHAIATSSQEAYRAWFEKNRPEVQRLQAKVNELRGGADRAALKAVLAEKKRFMHTAPSLLRDPTPLKATLTASQYQTFAEQLEQLKVSLHDPRRN